MIIEIIIVNYLDNGKQDRKYISCRDWEKTNRTPNSDSHGEIVFLGYE